MAQRRDLPRPMVRCGTGLPAHQTSRQFLEKGENLAAAQLAVDNGLTLHIGAVDLKHALRKINTYRDNFAHRTAPS